MKTIDLKSFRPNNSKSYSGRPQGLRARNDLKISLYDINDENVQILIPSDTTSFNPSFFLGLVYDSIQRLGLEDFKKKYHWKFLTDNPDRKRALLKNIEDGYRSADNSLNKRSIFSFFS